MTKQHTTKCKVRRAQAEEAFAKFEDKWPDFCRVCGATGATSWVENAAPYGAGYWPIEIEEVCEACWGKCPRCGYEFGEVEYSRFVQNQSPCPHCGWDWGNDPDDCAPACPDEMYCPCYMLEPYEKGVAWLRPGRSGAVICDRCERKMERVRVYKYQDGVVKQEYYYCPFCKVATERVDV